LKFMRAPSPLHRLIWQLDGTFGNPFANLQVYFRPECRVQGCNNDN